MRKIAAPLAFLALPTLAVLLALALLDALAWPWAALAALAVVAGLAPIVIGHARELAALRQRIDALSGERADESPRGASPADLGHALATADRILAHRDEAQRSSQAVTASVFEAVPDPLILLDRAHRILQVNAAARELFHGNQVGLDIAAVLRDPGLIEAVDEVLSGRPPQLASLSVAGVVERHFDGRVLRLAGGDGEEPRVLVALYDVTAIRKSQQMRADFVANVSHELRTPLATLLGFIETLMGPAKDDEEARGRFLAIMHQQAGRMTRLVRDLLSLSKIEETEHTKPTGSVNLATIISSVIDSLMLQAKAKSIAFELDFVENLPAAIGDGDQVAQVFQNLIDNAVKFTKPNTTIRITGRAGDRPGGRVAIAITDAGDGIAREHLPRLTERFYRVDAGRSRQLGGTGLGLAIVKHIVNRHRGALAIDSEIGKGTTVTVYLPEAT
jgi:two-component system, OmpR family, phosphate regulon sensor histidine kinase PhoR